MFKNIQKGLIGKIFIICVIFFLVSIAFIAVYSQNRTVDELHNSRKYVKLYSGGTIMKSYLDRVVVSSRGRHRTETKPIIVYKYVVNRQEYIRDVVSPNENNSTYLVTKYPEGAKVDVIYNRDAPHIAYLEVGNKTSWFLPLCCCLCATIVSFVVLISKPVKQKKKLKTSPSITISF